MTRGEVERRKSRVEGQRRCERRSYLFWPLGIPSSLVEVMSKPKAECRNGDVESGSRQHADSVS